MKTQQPEGVPTWLEAEARWDELRLALEREELTPDDLTRGTCARWGQWNTLMGVCCSSRGWVTRRSQPRQPDGSRPAVYQIRTDSIERMREITAVSQARARGWEQLDPLRPSFTLTDLEETVEESGKWIVYNDVVPCVTMMPELELGGGVSSLSAA